MNKNRTNAFSLIEAMIILTLISVAVLAMVPIVSKETTGAFWKKIEDNNIEYLTFGRRINQNVGIGVTDKEKMNSAKLVVDTAAINYINSPEIRLGSNCDDEDNPTNCTSTPAIDNNKLLIGQNTCTNANNAISIGSFNENRGNDNCDANNIIQIGDMAATAFSQTATPQTQFRINNRTVIELNDDDFDFNLPDGTNMFDYNADNTRLTFSQNISINGSTTFNNWNPGDAPDPAGMQTLKCHNQNFIKRNGDFRCDWLCHKAHEGISAGGDICSVSDKRLKNILTSYTKGFESIKQIETFLYTFKNDAKKKIHAGLIAQKLQGLFDEALHEDDKGYLSYEKEPILYAMVNSVKEIYASQIDLAKKQRKTNAKADRLLRKYSD